MSAATLHEWMAFDQLEPDPLPRLEFMLAKLMAMYGNSHRDPKRHPEFYRISDFMLERFDTPTQPHQTPEQAYGMVKAWAFLCGATKVQ